MSSKQYPSLDWSPLTESVERSGRWTSWVAAEPALATVGGLEELEAVAGDRDDPQRADALLAALVRLGAVDGGDDPHATSVVALLLTGGTARLAAQLRNLSHDIEQMVAAQVWLQIREFPWRRRQKAIAHNILMDARRAVLRDLGVDTRSRRRGEWVTLVDTLDEEQSDGSYRLVHHDDYDWLAQEPTLAEVLTWVAGKNLVADRDAATLLELAGLEVDTAVRGVSSEAELSAVAARRGVNPKTVARSRDRALKSLAGVRETYLRESGYWPPAPGSVREPGSTAPTQT